MFPEPAATVTYEVAAAKTYTPHIVPLAGEAGSVTANVLEGLQVVTCPAVAVTLAEAVADAGRFAAPWAPTEPWYPWAPTLPWYPCGPCAPTWVGSQELEPES